MSPAFGRALRQLTTNDRSRLTGSNLFGQALSFVGGLIIARSLGPLGRGNVAIVTVYDEASSTALNLGIPAAVGHYAAQAPPCEEASVEGRLIGAALKIAAVTAPLAALIAYLVDRYAIENAPSAIRLLVVVAITATPFVNSVPVACRMLLVARQQIDRLIVVTLTPTLVRVAILTALALAGQMTSATAGIAVLASSWLSSVIAWRISGVRVERGGSVGPLLRYGIQTVPGGLAGLTNSRLDQLLMVPLLSSRELGIYAVAVGVAFVPVNVGAALSLTAYREAARDDVLRTASTKRLRQAVMLTFGAAAVSALAAWFLLVPVYGDSFRDSVTPAVLLITGSAFIGTTSMLVQISNAAGRPATGSWSSISALVVTGVGLAIALPRFGVVGAAVVSMLAYSTQTIVTYILVRRHKHVGSLLTGRPPSIG